MKISEVDQSESNVEEYSNEFSNRRNLQGLKSENDNEQNNDPALTNFNMQEDIVSIDSSEIVKDINDDKINLFDYFNLEGSDFNEKEIENIKTAVNWYNDHIKYKSHYCRIIEDATTPKVRYLQNCMKSFPKCIIRSIRKICDCNANCMFMIFSHLEIDPCDLFEFEADFFDNKYLNCCWPHELLNGTLKPIFEGDNVQETAKVFLDEVMDLCNDSSKFDSDRCATYSLQNECLNDEDCLNSKSIFLDFNTCPNKEFEGQVEYLKKIFDVKIININSETKSFKKREIIFTNDHFPHANISNNDRTMSVGLNYGKVTEHSMALLFGTVAVALFNIVCMLIFIFTKHKKNIMSLVCIECFLMLFL